jgi:hypothetical protein
VYQNVVSIDFLDSLIFQNITGFQMPVFPNIWSRILPGHGKDKGVDVVGDNVVGTGCNENRG